MEAIKSYVNAALSLWTLVSVIFVFVVMSKSNLAVAAITFAMFTLPALVLLYAMNRFNLKISQEKDDFSGVTRIYTSKYKGCRYRALLKENVLYAIQLYIETNSSDWVYFHSAHGEDQIVLEFFKIDSDVKTHGFGEFKEVRTHEVFALNIPVDYLDKMSKKDWKIKAYGEKGDRVFMIPQIMTQPFFEHIKTYIGGSLSEKQKRPDPNSSVNKEQDESKRNEFFTAVAVGDIVKIKELLKSGVSVNQKDVMGNTLLGVAQTRSPRKIRAEVVTLLREHGATEI